MAGGLSRQASNLSRLSLKLRLRRITLEITHARFQPPPVPRRQAPTSATNLSWIASFPIRRNMRFSSPSLGRPV